jgi:hypothetical protein
MSTSPSTAKEATTLELGRGAHLPLLSPALPFRPPGELAANDAEERDRSGLEGGGLGEEREPESEARALSRPTVRLRAPASQARPRDVEEDIPTKRAGAYLSAVPTPPEAMPGLGKLPRHVVLALVLGPLASSALSAGLMQVLLHKDAPEPGPQRKRSALRCWPSRYGPRRNLRSRRPARRLWIPSRRRWRRYRPSRQSCQARRWRLRRPSFLRRREHPHPSTRPRRLRGANRARSRAEFFRRLNDS